MENENELNVLHTEKRFNKELLIWSGIGFASILLIGNLFHFIYEWLPWKPYAWFFPINESMWEHSKLSFWPGLIFFIIQYFYLRKNYQFLAPASAISLYSGILVMQSFYYTIEGAFGEEARTLALSILSYIFAIFIQQMSYYFVANTKIKASKKTMLIIDIISFTLILILMVLVIVFTFVQPKIPLFYDSMNEIYGFIPES